MTPRRHGLFLGMATAFALTTGIALADLADGIVAYWHMDGNAQDASGNGWHGTEINKVEWAPGQAGDALKLDGTDGRIEVQGFALTTNDITFVAWINGWKTEAWGGIVGARVPTATEMIFGDNDTVHYVWNNNDAATWGWANGPAIPQDQWAMVALTVDPNRATGYVYTNGAIKSASNDIKHVEQNVGVIQIGWVDCCGGTRRFKGLIDEVLIYDRALSEDELVSLAKGDLLSVEPTGKLGATWGHLKTR